MLEMVQLLGAVRRAADEVEILPETVEAIAVVAQASQAKVLLVVITVDVHLHSAQRKVAVVVLLAVVAMTEIAGEMTSNPAIFATMQAEM